MEIRKNGLPHGTGFMNCLGEPALISRYPNLQNLSYYHAHNKGQLLITEKTNYESLYRKNNKIFISNVASNFDGVMHCII